MTPDDRTRLLKLLALIDSDSDGEALAAARQAGRLLRGLGTSWAELIPEITPLAETAADRPPGDAELLDALIAAPSLSPTLKTMLMRDRVRLNEGKWLSQQTRTYLQELYRKMVETPPGTA